MPILKDLMGQRFGRLEVLDRAPNKKTKTRWRCRCDCGNETIINSDGLRTGESQSCGCLRRETVSQLHLHDLRGQRFGRLEVLEMSSARVADGGATWRCLCACGEEKVISAHNLTGGKTQSCGCLMRDASARQKLKAWSIRAAKRRQAIIAAKHLTELLGIPHIVVESIDPQTGEKAFQPLPQMIG